MLLFVLPLALRLFPIEHGLPRTYVPDTHVVRNALGMARDKDPVPPVGRYSTYPYLTSYVLVPAYGAQYALGRVTGAWAGAGEFARHALERPGDVFLTARLVVALLGAATVWVTFRAARAAGLGAGAWAAAWLVATAVLHVHFSVEERPWVPLALCMALCMWGAVAYAARGERRALFAAAAAGGLAFAAHQIGAFCAGLVLLAWLLGPPSEQAGAARPSLASRLPRLAACAALFLAVAVPLGHPYLLRFGLTDASRVVGGEAGAELGGLSVGGQRMLLRFDLDAAGPVLASFLSYDPVLVVLGAAGLVLALRRRALWPVAMFTLAWSVYFAVYHNARVRYFLPVEAFLALPAGLVVERLTRRPATRALAVVLLALPLVQALRFASVLQSEDTRALGEARLAALPGDTRVAVDRYGPEVDLDRASLERLRALREARGEPLRPREAHRLALLEAKDEGAPIDVEPGVDAVRIEELCGFDEELGTVAVREELRERGADPRALLSALGVTHLLLVERRPGEEPNLLAGLVEGREPVWVVDPARGDETPGECVLPMEMRAPLLGLWRIERPGPRLALYRLE